MLLKLKDSTVIGTNTFKYSITIEKTMVKYRNNSLFFFNEFSVNVN